MNRAWTAQKPAPKCEQCKSQHTSEDRPWLTHLAYCGLLLSQAHNEDAVGLSYASLCPGRERAVCLVEHNAMDILLLTQPVGQPVLMDAAMRYLAVCAI